jgi:phosphate starvation-inducible PhoH-like protein
MKDKKLEKREKIKVELKIREFKWSDKQKEMIKTIQSNESKIVFLRGVAGSGKTALAVYCALKLLEAKKMSDVTYIRSAVESADNKLGYMPGLLEDKIYFYTIPLLEKLNELLPKNQSELLLKEGRIQGFPVNFSRGTSISDTVIIFDEAQNSSTKEIITVLTRMGEHSKCIICADPMQSDLTNGKSGGFDKICSLFDNEESQKQGIFIFDLDENDIVRSEILKFLIKKFKELK